MEKPSIIVTGKNGQLGKELQDIAPQFENFTFHFFSKEELSIADASQLENIFIKLKPAFFINCAAYTAVDKAETDQENAYIINGEAVGNIARLCRAYNCICIHISTDYVFDGTATEPYKENDETNPVNYYGYTKWVGEKLALENNPQTIIIRTSWVYSQYGNNFVKTMMRIMQERKEINVVSDQTGSPTYAADLALAIIAIINNLSQSRGQNLKSKCGIYHFSNEGIISWFQFASAIRDIKNFDCKVHPISTANYPTPAKRPAWSVFSKDKIKSNFNIELKDWKESLQNCLHKIIQ